MLLAMLLPCAFCLAVLPTSLASESCEASSRSLLQASIKQQHLKKEGTATSTLEMREKVRAIIEEVLADKRNLSSSEHAAFQLMNETLQSTITSINIGHADDQTLMNVAYGALENCNTNFQNESSNAASLESAADTKMATHASCRETESSLAAVNASEWQDLEAYLSNLALPNVSIPSSALALEPYFTEMINWFTNSNLSYTEHETSYESAHEALETKGPECDLAQSRFESSYCQWHISALNAEDDYKRCWDQGVKVFNATQAAAFDSAEQRKLEYTAVRTLQCYMKVLDAGVESATTRLEDCEALVVNTSSLDLVNSATPLKGDVSQLGDLTLMPGDPTWEAQKYAGLASNSPAAAVTPCNYDGY